MRSRLQPRYLCKPSTDTPTSTAVWPELHYLPLLRWTLARQLERMDQAEARLRITNDRVELLVDGLLDWCGCEVRSRDCR